MLRLGRLTDYGIVLLGYLAQQTEQENARELALRAGLPRSTVEKLLKRLAGAGVLVSSRGARGGYSLARSAANITLAQVYLALEGPIAVTQGGVSKQARCSIGSNWIRLDRAIHQALEQLTLWDLTVHPDAALACPNGRGTPARARKRP